ncbi:unknown protein [Microcystis aeruginosa NIES-843]|uniref:Uncharacterized protein n=1 Tax=Microcystis aeruginosa (strain NIES-843 / IAM M-2473) TaxID=449447 RepID=B0JM30_MICAN|nr:unknown protein [Microcystis aeruginosa NIES-843]
MSSGDQYFFGFVHTDLGYVLPLAWGFQRPSASPYSSSTRCRTFNLVCLLEEYL